MLFRQIFDEKLSTRGVDPSNVAQLEAVDRSNVATLAFSQHIVEYRRLKGG